MPASIICATGVVRRLLRPGVNRGVWLCRNRPAPVVVGYGICGVQPDRLGVIADRFVVISLLIVGEAAVVVGCGRFGVQPDRLVVIADRLVVVLALVEFPSAGFVEYRIGARRCSRRWRGRRTRCRGWSRHSRVLQNPPYCARQPLTIALETGVCDSQGVPANERF